MIGTYDTKVAGVCMKFSQILSERSQKTSKSYGENRPNLYLCWVPEANLGLLYGEVGTSMYRYIPIRRILGFSECAGYRVIRYWYNRRYL